MVLEERRLRTENSVFGLMEEQLEALVFLAHPYRWPVIGWMEDIERISREDCLEYFRTYYAPNNASIYGSATSTRTRRSRCVERYYGDIPAGPAAAAGRAGRAAAARRATRGGPLPGAGAGGPRRAGAGPRRGSPDTAALDVLQAASRSASRRGCAAGSSRRRSSRCRSTRAGAGASTPASSSCSPSSRRARTGDRAERVLWEELAKVATRG